MVAIHRRHEFGIRRGFVDEALAEAVHDHAARQVALDEQRALLLLARDTDRRRAPHVRHQRQRAAEPVAFGDRVAGVGRRRRAPLRLRRLRQVALAHRLVALEAARAEDHATPRGDRHRLPAALRAHARHAAVDVEQVAHRRIEPHGHVAVEQRAAQPADQRVAERQAPVAPRAAAHPDIEPVAAELRDRELHEAGPRENSVCASFDVTATRPPISVPGDAGRSRSSSSPSSPPSNGIGSSAR